MSAESDVDRWLRHVHALEAAIRVVDMEAARLAWFALGLELAHNTYVVLRPGDLPILAGGREPTLAALCDWVDDRWKDGAGRSAVGNVTDLPMTCRGAVFDTVQAVARALLRQSEEWEP